jgi:hypothetical protein
MALLATLALLGCGGGGGGGGGSGSNGGGPSLSVVSSAPSNGSSGLGLSLTTITVAFNKPVATTYASFSWPHLSNVEAYLLLQDETDTVPITYFLDYDDSTNSLVFYLSDPPQANHVYRLTLIDGLTSEAGLRMTGDASIQYAMGAATFGSGIFANQVIDYAPELPAGATLGQGRYIPDSVLGQGEGALHTVSLGDDGVGPGGSITVTFGADMGGTAYCIVDGADDDFIVHENVFGFTDGYGLQNFTEAAYVEVSEDNVNWYRFANSHPAPGAPNLDQVVGVPDSYSGLAGIRVGGDAFDLLALQTTGILLGGAPAISPTFRACYARIVDGGADIPDYSSDGQYQDDDPSGADIDAIEVLHAAVAP